MVVKAQGLVFCCDVCGLWCDVGHFQVTNS